MMHNKAHEIKRQQKKSLYLRVISQLIHPLINEDKVIPPMFASRLELSKDAGICYVYFSSADAGDQRQVVEGALKVLILYKPSLRTALAKATQARRVPDLVFLYDEQHEKERRINDLLDKVCEDLDTKK
ncbi:MAG: ribosome-binding factor A [Candidatus Babeliales bacterium]